MNLAEHLYSAAAAPLGIVIESDDRERLRQKLYALLRELPDLPPLAFILSPTVPDQLWIVKKEPTGAES